MKTKKIVIVGPAHPFRGGIANFNDALAIAYTRAGCQVEIISFSLQYPGFLFPGKTQYDHSAQPPARIKISELINSINPFSWFKAANHIVKTNPEYVIVRFWLPFMGPALGTIARLIRNQGIRVIAITDNVIPHEKRFGDRLFTRYFVKSCDGFVAMSKSVLNDLTQFSETPNKIFLPHPVYDIFGAEVDMISAQKKLNLDPDKQYVLFFGLIRHYKGLDLLFQAFALLKDRFPNLRLVVAGEMYEDADRYFDLIKTLAISDIVRMDTRFIPSDEVKYYFSSVHLIAQPYRTATQSGVTQIAYHFGKPMLVTNVGGLAEIVPDKICGYVTQPGPEEIAACLAEFFETDQYETMRAAVYKEKKRFEWQAMVEGIDGLFQRL